MAGIDKSTPPILPKKASLLSVLLVVLLSTLLAGGIGFGVGSFLLGKAETAQVAPWAQGSSTGSGAQGDGAHGDGAQQSVEQVTGEAGQAEKHGEGPAIGEPVPKMSDPRQGDFVRQLAPIVSNLANPKDVWVRLEIALVLKKDAASDQDMIAVRSADQVVDLLRTTSLEQIDGPSGLVNLRDDLSDLLVHQKDSLISEVLISSFVVE